MSRLTWSHVRSVSLPDGDYRLRVNGVGRIGRTYRFAVNRGETQSHTISIDEGRLRGGEQSNVAVSGPHARAAPIPFAHSSGAGDLGPGRRTSFNSMGNP